MAVARVSTKKVEKVVTVDEEVLLVELTLEEAALIRLMLGYVSSPSNVKSIVQGLYDTLNRFVDVPLECPFNNTPRVREHVEEIIKGARFRNGRSNS